MNFATVFTSMRAFFFHDCALKRDVTCNADKLGLSRIILCLNHMYELFHTQIRHKETNEEGLAIF